MDKLLYKGYLALDNLRNRDSQKKKKNDYLFVKREETEIEGKKEKKVRVRNYKIYVPKENEMSSVKILNEQKFLKAYLTGEEMEFFRKDNFQRKYLFEVPRLLWQLERLNEIGDYLLLFPNPDY